MERHITQSKGFSSKKLSSSMTHRFMTDILCFLATHRQRGAPENVGKHIRAIHPIVRTNPVSGWNSIYALGHHVEHINNVTPAESTRLLDWLHDIVVLNHDIHVRHRWVNDNDVALWDNR